jgi:DNA-binding transcriptional LysR family regulator
MRFLRVGQAQTVKLQPILSVSDNDSAASAAMAGLGITRLLSYQIAEPLQTGKLKIVLSEFESPPIPIYIMHREGRHSSAKIRSFVDLMAERLRTELSLN